MYRCTLSIGGEVSDVTDDIRNWEEIEASFKRDGYGGVVRSFTSKFGFVGKARDALLDEFGRNYLRASASISLATRGDGWDYEERFSCSLDFTTVEDDGATLYMNAVDNGIAAMIKAKKGTEYEYAVSEIREAEQLSYDGIDITETAKWQPVSDTEKGSAEADRVNVHFSSAERYFPLYSMSDEIAIGGKFIPADQSEYADNYFIDATQGGYLRLLFNLDFKMALEEIGDFASVYGVKFSLVVIPNDGGDEQVVHSFEMRPKVSSPEYETVSYSGMHRAYFFGCKLALKSVLIYDIHIEDVPGVDSFIDVYTTSYISASWSNRISPVKIDLVSPLTLLNRLLKSMNGGKEGITGEIEASSRTDKAMLCAAESIRGIDGARMYSSFTKFCEWMEAVFGYVYGIDGQRVVFRKRSSFFRREVMKHVYDYSEYGLSLSSDLIFSRVSAGYDRQDYDSVNGRDEFNFTSQYTTGALNTENSLSLVSPYRADSFGIEFLAEKRGQDTTDNESDKDMFFVGVSLSEGKYVLDRSVEVSGVSSPSTVFNAMFSPSSVVEANADYIAACTDFLEFASSDGNPDAVIGGKAENRDIALGSPLFSVREVTFETSDTELPEDIGGMVTLHASSGDVSGYVKSADYAYTRRKSARYTLITEMKP